MSREILFRGKRVDTGEWAYGSYNVVTAEGKEHHYIFWQGSHTPVNGETIGQFTGITDEKGQRLFEGDIMKSVHFKEAKKTHYLYHRVSWSERLHGWFAVNTDNKTDSWEVSGNIQLFVFTRHGSYSFEVIGNIHDNPDLP